MRAQAPVPAAEQAELTRTVTELDTKLFDAYNHCDLKTLGAMVSDDLEFYHDQTGLMVGKAPFLEAIQNNICGKVERTLVPGSMEVYRLKGYGAVEIGVHRFHQRGRCGRCRRGGEICHGVAEQGGGLEGDTGDQLRPRVAYEQVRSGSRRMTARKANAKEEADSRRE